MLLHLHWAPAQVIQKKKEKKEYSQTIIYCSQSRDGELRLRKHWHAQDCPGNCSRAKKLYLLSQDLIPCHSHEIHYPHSSIPLSVLKNWEWRGGQQLLLEGKIQKGNFANLSQCLGKVDYRIMVADTMTLIWQKDGDSLWIYTQPEHCTCPSFSAVPCWLVLQLAN